MDFLNTLTDNTELFRKGFLGTLALTGSSALIALVLGTLMAAFRVSPVPVLRWIGTTWVTILRNTPLTLLFFASVFAVPKLGLNQLTYFVLAMATLGFYTSAFVCEVVRSGINTVPIGQAEAARSLGLTFSQTLRTVILPQAGRTVIGPIGSVLIALTKNSAIAGGFNVVELFSTQKTLTENANPLFAVFFWIALGYLLITLVLSGIFRGLENRLAVAR
ncbi:amino acid ABC transporter permease [Mangrovactinospora gilvigrisea]|uniref:Amino acid ABC transporter permease n=1 Tax=Mangrovactinospora gilvigrisea TaxID=1428644 RepID=A0A1J7BCT6_9ACTN|nr:amino acid ABC transporter permease [Mangrovactinospora gilvigrisea]OIV36462.1 amino acid ABC transporter permease [Mangrovactinospora gilvigrisea]